MLFSNLLGNPGAKLSLQRMLATGEVAHTLLFFGPDGVGKALFAKEFAAKLLGIKEGRTLENHPDLHIYKPEGKSSTHSIASMRGLIDEVNLSPFEAKRKVFIIYDAERMQPAGSNALLKTLEEPTLDSVIILLTSEIDELLPTIVSRCRQVAFFSIGEDEIYHFVKDKLGKSEDEARRIAMLSQGSMAKANLIAKSEDDPQKELLLEILSKHVGNYPELLSALAKLESMIEVSDEEDGGEGIRSVDALLDQILHWYRDLHALKLGCDVRYLFYRDRLDLLKSSNSPPPLERVVELIAKIRYAVSHNVRLRVGLEKFFLEIA